MPKQNFFHRKTQEWKRPIISFLFLFILSYPTLSLSQSSSRQIGVIDNPGPNNIILRENPPVVTSVSYALSNKICSIGDGTEFEITKELQILNGEKWYEITISGDRRVSNPIGCPNRRPLSGWIIGQFSDGQRVISLSPPESQQNETNSSSDITSDEITPEEKRLLNEADQNERVKTGRGLGFAKYLYLSIGSFIGLLVITIEREDSRTNFSPIKHVFKAYSSGTEPQC